MTTIDSSQCPNQLEEDDPLGRVGLSQNDCSRVVLRVKVDIDGREGVTQLDQCLKRPTLRMLSHIEVGGARSAHTTFTVATSIEHLVRDAQALSQFGSVKLLGERWSDPAGMTSLPAGRRGQKGDYVNRAQRKLQLPREVQVRLAAILRSQCQPEAPSRLPKPWGQPGEVYA